MAMHGDQPADDRIGLALAGSPEAEQTAESDTGGARVAIGRARHGFEFHFRWGAEPSVSAPDVLAARDVSAPDVLAGTGDERAHKAQVSAARALVALRGRTGRPVPDEVLALANEAEV
jgi:hypothetical protein